jgi:fimbrial isopeptide formation D2 family protein
LNLKRDFPLTLPENLQDLVINVTAITPPRSNFKNSYLLTYKNAGAITKSGKVTFAYNAKQTYIEATQAPTSNTNSMLTWDYANLQPNESRTLKVTFKTAADVPIRTQLTNVATIEPIATDTFKTDNVDSSFQIVVGSYDPNDKQVSFLNTRQTPSVIDPNTELTYTIRFQNTGNYQADFVRVTDTLSDKLDLTTLRVLATSHNYTLSVKNKNVLQFEFNPIYLPDSMTSEANSHGFIKFAIKPKKTLTKDEVIKNTAYIFFDYNPAIITNTVETANQKVNGLFTPSETVLKPISH